jgi:hypothetical protein
MIEKELRILSLDTGVFNSIVLFIRKIHGDEIMILFQYCKTYNVLEKYM